MVAEGRACVQIEHLEANRDVLKVAYQKQRNAADRCDGHFDLADVFALSHMANYGLLPKGLRLHCPSLVCYCCICLT